MKIDPIKLEDFKIAIQSGQHPQIDYVGDKNCWRIMFSNGGSIKGSTSLKRVVTSFPDDPEFFFVINGEEKGWKDVLEQDCHDYTNWEEMTLADRLAISKKHPDVFTRVGDFVILHHVIFHLDNINLTDFLKAERLKVKKLLNQTRSWMYQRIKPVLDKPAHLEGNVFTIEGLDINIYMNDGEDDQPPIYEEDVPEAFTIIAEITAGVGGLQYPETEIELLSLVYSMMPKV